MDIYVIHLIFSAIILTMLENQIANKTNVTLQGDTLYYQGYITDEANEKAKQLITSEVTTLAIKSRGGDINLGMDLGELVRKKSLNIMIEKYCLSSCANYVFTAGKKKYLHEDSLLAWHGGATQKIDLDNISSDQHDYILSQIKPLIKRETLYFKKIGVQQKITTYGQQDKFHQYGDHYEGWTFSLRALNQLGVDNIVLLDRKWDPDLNYIKGKRIFMIASVD